LNVPVAKLEYSIDSITGFAPLAAFDADTAVSAASNLEITPGMHTVWFRASDEQPYSGSLLSKSFFAFERTLSDSSNTPLTGIEYSFDSISAFVPIPVGIPDTSVLVEDNLDISELIGHGEHVVAIRAFDANNQRGPVLTGVFSVENELPVAHAGNDRYAGDNTLVTIDGSASTDLNHDNLIYHWTPPAGITLSSNHAARPTFTAPTIVSDTNLVFLLYVNDGLVDSPVDTLVVRIIHNQIAITDTTIESGVNQCVNAYSTLIIAGGDTAVIFNNGSNMTLIAGELIRFLPGFKALPGCYVIAYIEDGAGFCDKVGGGSLLYQPPVEKSMAQVSSVIGSSASAAKQVKIYPNPTHGQVMVELRNYDGTSEVNITNPLGAILHQTKIGKNEPMLLDLSHLGKGLYFVQIKNQNDNKVEKLIIR